MKDENYTELIYIMKHITRGNEKPDREKNKGCKTWMKVTQG